MPDDESPAPRVPLGVVVVGLLIGLGLGVVAAWALRTPSTAPDEVVQATTTTLPETAEAAEAFISAWERSRRATYLTVSRWHRVTDVGAELTETRLFAQRPPDRIRYTGRSLSGSVGGVRHVCDESVGDDAGAVNECREFPVEITSAEYDASVEREVALMWRHVEGTRPLYRVSQDGDCFQLRLDRIMLSPPYGYRTTFCFDDTTGAIRELEIRRAEGTDTERMLWASTTVSDADLAAIVDGSFEPDRFAPGDADG